MITKTTFTSIALYLLALISLWAQKSDLVANTWVINGGSIVEGKRIGYNNINLLDKEYYRQFKFYNSFVDSYTNYTFYQKPTARNGILIYLIFATIALTITRINYRLTHPQITGARYFFFPFVLLSWFLINNYTLFPKSYDHLF